MSAIEENIRLSCNVYPLFYIYKTLKIVLEKISNYNSVEVNNLDGCNLVCRGRPNRGSLSLYLRVRGGSERIREAKPSPNGLKASVLGLAIIRAMQDWRVGWDLELKENYIVLCRDGVGRKTLELWQETDGQRGLKGWYQSKWKGSKQRREQKVHYSLFDKLKEWQLKILHRYDNGKFKESQNTKLDRRVYLFPNRGDEPLSNVFHLLITSSVTQLSFLWGY